MTLLYIYTLYISVNCSFPLQKMVCNMYNNTNSTGMRQFWEYLGWRL